MVRGNMTTVRVKAEELAGANHQITGIWYNPDSVHYKSVSLSWRPLRLPGFFLSLSAGLCQEVRAGQCLVRGSLLPAHTPGRVPVWGGGCGGTVCRETVGRVLRRSDQNGNSLGRPFPGSATCSPTGDSSYMHVYMYILFVRLDFILQLSRKIIFLHGCDWVRG